MSGKDGFEAGMEVVSEGFSGAVDMDCGFDG